MIEVNNIINFNRTDEELEELILFLVAVAGKNADTTARQLDNFLAVPQNDITPFEWVKLLADSPKIDLKTRLKEYGFGCQTRLARAFTELVNSGINLRTCSLEDLTKIHGIGRKSASCFLAWTRKGVRVAMLDTHLLKWLKLKQEQARKLRVGATGNIEAWRPFLELEMPKSTPTSKRVYDLLEEYYLEWCETARVDPIEMDLEIWRSYANH